MFEKEIQFITDFNLNKIKRLGSFFTLEDLTKARIHPAVVQYISAEIDYLIYLDRQNLMQKSVFDYSGPEIAKHFLEISAEIKKQKLLPYEEVKKIVQQAVSFHITFLLRPVWTLKKFVYDNAEVRSHEEVKLFFNYIYFYDYYKKIFLAILEKKQLLTISVYEFEALLEKIQIQLFDQQIKNILENALVEMAEFLNTGEVTRTRLSIETLEIFLKDKKLHEYIFKVRKLLSIDPKQKFDLSEIKAVLFSSITPDIEQESFEAELFNEKQKDESQLDIFSPSEEIPQEEQEDFSTVDDEQREHESAEQEPDYEQEPEFEPEKENEIEQEQESEVTYETEQDQRYEQEVQDEVEDTEPDEMSVEEIAPEEEMVKDEFEAAYDHAETKEEVSLDLPESEFNHNQLDQVGTFELDLKNILSGYTTSAEEQKPENEQPYNEPMQLDNDAVEPREEKIEEEAEETHDSIETDKSFRDYFQEELKNNDFPADAAEDKFEEEIEEPIEEELEEENAEAELPAYLNEDSVDDEEQHPAAQPEIDIFSYFSTKETMKIITAIFNHDSMDFANTLERIAECSREEDAEQILKDVFQSYRVNSLGREATMVKEKVERFFHDKGF